MDIPAWNSEGLIPPLDAGDPVSNTSRSPYEVDIADFCDYFGTSQERIAILKSFLKYRDLIYKTGITDGFQWVNGSFTEQIEARESRPPNDIDVVNCVEIPAHYLKSEAAAAPIIYPLALKAHYQNQIKINFKVDAYTLHLGAHAFNYNHCKLISYWYSLWSHTRDGTWKGFLSIKLDPIADIAANIILDKKTVQVGEVK